ncbi:MAG: hypothetical protein NTW86_04280 [Candidatus Sumerlaeota bacterium]|nr:hypothetical protein [Candidatus Sumerlaeota bacterium]
MSYLLPVAFRQLRQAALTLALMAQASAPAWSQSQPPQAVNNQDERVNVDAPAPDRDGLLTIFRSGDKTQVNRYVSQVIELKNAEGLELIPHVLKAVKLEGGTARALKYADAATGKTRYFLQVVTTERQMPSIIDSIKAIDLPGITSSEGELNYAVRMRYRRASEVAQIVGNTSLSGDGQVFADDISNTVWIFDSQSDGKRDQAFIDFFDVPPPQVEFDLEAVEVSEDKAGKVGLDWEAWKRSLGGQIEITGNQFEGGEGFARLDGLLTLDARTLAEFLNYATQTGSARTLHHSRVTASNESPAVIRSEERVPNLKYARTDLTSKVLTETAPGVSATGENGDAASQHPVAITPPATFTRQDAGLQEQGIEIVIQPTIGAEMVTARMQVTVASIVGFNELDEPILSSRDLDTQATLKDREPFLVGSLKRESTNKWRRGIPGLKSVPAVRWLFSVEGERTQRSRLFVIATPTFKNQLAYCAHSLTGTNPDATPMVNPTAVPLAADAASWVASPSAVSAGPSVSSTQGEVQ